MLLNGSSGSSLSGFERSFEAIFKHHYRPLLSYCRHMLGSREEAEDALQQAFVRAHRALRSGTVPRELRPWLYAIARNCCLSAITVRQPTVPLSDHDADRAVPAVARFARDGLADEVRVREDLRELLAGIARLPEDQRSALLLAELGDLSHVEIAAVVECPVNKVKALVYQARSALIADRDAREASCQDIRERLSVARGGELRRGPLRRHLKLCAGCREFQLAVASQRESLAILLPVAPSAGLAAAIFGHGAAHVAGAGASGVSAGAGITAPGAMAGAGATAASGTTMGATLGGGALAKLAIGGAIAAVTAAGVVATHRLPGAGRHRAGGHPAERRLADHSDSASVGRLTAASSPVSPTGIPRAGRPARAGRSGRATAPLAPPSGFGKPGASPTAGDVEKPAASLGEGTSFEEGASLEAGVSPGTGASLPPARDTKASSVTELASAGPSHRERLPRHASELEGAGRRPGGDGERRPDTRVGLGQRRRSHSRAPHAQHRQARPSKAPGSGTRPGPRPAHTHGTPHRRERLDSRAPAVEPVTSTHERTRTRHEVSPSARHSRPRSTPGAARTEGPGARSSRQHRLPASEGGAA